MNGRRETSPPDRGELLRHAEELAPLLRERSAGCEQERKCPEATIDDYVRSGLLRICQPRRYGGYELGWDVLCEVSQTLARGCGSQAWVQNVLTDHCQKVATFPLEAQDEVWEKTPNARISASFDPVGKGRVVAGGVMYSGRHSFSSGIDHAQWILCGGHRYRDETRGDRCFFLVNREDVTIIDDWYVMGFAGTGSKSFEVRDVFIPSHRILSAQDADDGTGPGRMVNSAPIFALPRAGITSTGFAAVAVGIAEGFLAEYLRYTRPRKSRGADVAALMGTQMGVGAAAAEINAAALIYLEPAREAMLLLERGTKLGKELRLRAKRDSGFAVQLALGAVTRLFNSAGGRALSTNGTMQRQYRDLLAAASHHSIVWDNVTAEYGEFALKDAGSSA